jgi:hypothetical protein
MLQWGWTTKWSDEGLDTSFMEKEIENIVEIYVSFSPQANYTDWATATFGEI